MPPKAKKRNSKTKNGSNNSSRNNAADGYGATKNGTNPNPNPLLKVQTEFLESIPTKHVQNFFSDAHTSPSTRAEIWSNQAELGEELVNRHAWATPDERCMKILSYFGKNGQSSQGEGNGIVEVGCGANAYWARMMKDNGIDVMAFDVSLGDGGQIQQSEEEANGGQIQGQSSKSKNNGKSKGKGKKRKREPDQKKFEDGFVIHRGGPEVLSRKKLRKRALFLCYPDEDVMESDDEDGEHSHNAESMGAACLEHYKGNTVIHVGELFGDTPSMDQAPWGRSSGPAFQQRLAAEYHCVLKAKLTSWLHVKDTISVWKRTKLCSIVFQGDEDDESDEEVEYRHVPEEERLPVDLAAPSFKHLLE